jgi:hypothetical protein
MIVVRMRGGLGNQMFQYALGRRLAIETGEALKLDTTWYARPHRRGVTERQFNLPHFDIQAEIATAADLRRIFAFGGIPMPRRVVHLLNRGAEKVGPRLAELVTQLSAALFDYYWEIRDVSPSEDHDWPYSRQFAPLMLGLVGDCYLAGFWQSRRYFEEVADTIRSDLTVVEPPEGKNADVAQKIDDALAVGVHVRRGDFVDTGGSLSAGFYERAAATLEETVNDPSYFVFSNDTDWVEANLKLGEDVTVVRHNDGSTDYEDLRLLSRCNHQIISNGTFSWWGAWLNDYPHKRVIGPWRSKERNDDFVPPKWSSIDA